AAGELRGYLAARLPEFMIPSVFTEVAALPLTANGKVDRAALPAPDAGRADLGGEYAAPRSQAEELLAGIWAQVLGLDRAGIYDSFFVLGGHSLLAIQVISRVREVFGSEVPVAALFDQPTVAGLAGVIESGVPGLAVPPVVPAGRDEPLPLSFAQQRLWFIDQLEPGSAEYNAPSPVPLGQVDVAALTAALGAVVARHEVLRTRLVAGGDGVPYQAIDPPGPFWLPVADVSGAADPVAAARGLLAADAVAPFDLAAGPLIRAALIRVAAGQHVLALTVHHVVSDEWSGRILRRELFVLYEALRQGKPDRLPPLAVQYADFAIWQRRWLAGEVLEGQLAYWRGQLAGAPVLELPTDRPRPPVRSPAGALAWFTVPAEVAAGLRGVARAGGATMFMTLLAALAVLLGRYAGQDDVVAGTPVANRNRAETEALIGFFVNTLVMRADLSGDPSFTGLLGRVRAMALAAYAHQDLPFEQLVDALVTDRDRSRTPLFSVFFSFVATARGEEPSPARVTSRQASIVPGTSGGNGAVLNGPTAAKYDLSVTLGQAPGGGLGGGVEYSIALFDAATAERMAGHLAVLLGAVAEDMGRHVRDLPVLTAEEREQLLGTWNDTKSAVPVEHGLHQMVAT
ncbi:MAG TPA: condensation domain-containing protein, partial [Streptosporangiaceae bacterium]|nr:condensation domain-containing protein [Streptosporangiaceae bacterium]